MILQKWGINMNKKSVLAIVAVITVILSMVFTACSDNTEGEIVNGNSSAEGVTRSVIDESAVTSNDHSIEDNGNANDVSQNAENTVSENQSQTVATEETQPELKTAEEIVAYFNTAANKIKTDAVKVVKNYEKRSIGELVVPDILQSTAESLLPTFIKDDTEPIIYDTREEIQSEYIVPNQSYVSRLTAADVVKATCVDNGKEYEIYFKLKNEKNPVSGKGVGSVCDVIEAHDVAEKAPSFVKNFETEYTDCEVRATIDKKTGRVIHATYSTPVALNVTVDMLGTHNVTANFIYVKDYTITY